MNQTLPSKAVAQPGRRQDQDVFRSHRILAAVDATDPGMWSAGLASDLAERFACDLGVVHVVQPPTFGDVECAKFCMETQRALKEDGRRFLDRLPLEAAPGQKMEHLLREGDPATQVVAAAAEWDADLVVAGTHARRGLTRLFLGSVAAAIVRQAPCPVLCVRRPPEQPIGRRVLVAVNFDEASHVAIRWANRLAIPGHGELKLAHGVWLPKPQEAAIGLGDIDTVLSVRRSAFNFLNALRSECTPAAMVSTELQHGGPANVIVQIAKTWKADLIVMGINKHKALERLVLGNTTEAVLRRADCPVLCVSA